MKRLAKIFFVFIAMLSAAFPVPAAVKEEARESTVIIIKTLSVSEAEALTGKAGVYFFDVRGDFHYESGHLPGAAPMPFEWTSQGDITERECRIDVSLLPKDKDSIVVFYSFGPTTLKSYKAYRAAMEAVRAGYRNVCYIKAGYEGWVQAEAEKNETALKISIK